MSEGLPNWDDIPPEFKERYRADIEAWVGLDTLKAELTEAFEGRDSAQQSRREWREKAALNYDLLSSASRELRDLRAMVHAVNWNNIPAAERLKWRDRLDATISLLGNRVT